MTECVEWQGLRDRLGYGRVWTGTVKMLVHRRAWELMNGPIPGGLCVLHRCDNPPCFNVAHLFLGTRLDNNRDMAAKGRAPGTRGRVGELANHRILSASDANEIRTAIQLGCKQADLARLYGVTSGVVSHIFNGIQWVSK